MLTREKLEERLKILQRQREHLLGNLNYVGGAIQVLEELLAPEQDTPAEKNEGASE